MKGKISLKLLITIFLLILIPVANSYGQINLSGNYSVLWSKKFISNIQKIANNLDLTGDGVRDVVVVLSDSSTIEIQALRGYDGSLLWNKNLSATNNTAKNISIEKMGDIDGDNCDDFLIKIDSDLYAISGKSGLLKWHIVHNEPIFGDFNGDGIIDLLIKGSNYIEIINGKTGQRIFYEPIYANYAIYTIGDVDGDNGQDIFIEIKYMSYYKSFKVISGKGIKLWEEEIRMPSAEDWIISDHILSGGDLDGDGNNDLILCYDLFYKNYPQSYYQHKIVAKKGNEGTNLWNITYTDSYTSRFETMWLISDIDGDRLSDIVICDRVDKKTLFLNGKKGRTIYSMNEPYYFVGPFITKSLGQAGGKIYIEFSNISFIDFNNDKINDFIIASQNKYYQAITGNSFIALWSRTFETKEGETFTDIDFVKDITGDNINELIVTAYKSIDYVAYGQRAWILDGTNGETLWVQNLENGYSDLYISQIDDVDGDGLADFIVYQRNINVNNLLLIGPSKLILKTGREGHVIWEAISDEVIYAKSPQDFNNNNKQDILIYSKNELYLIEVNFNICTPPFTDVPCDHWAINYINAVKDAGITKGCNPPQNDRFCPEDVVTRAQMAAFIIRAIEGEPVSYNPNPYFADVPPTHWAFKYVQRVRERGIAQGYPGTNLYGPEDNVTREQMAKMLIMGLVSQGKISEPPTDYCASGSPFIDVDPSNWSCRYIKRLKELGITQGCNPPENDRYCPQDGVTRAQMAAFIYRAFLK
jgi:hypothetical protein